jgi:hypothetical protein
VKIILGAQAVVLGLLLVVAADLYAHKRVEHLGGVNIWGYRGSTARARVPGDVRVVYVGGTRAFGYGVHAEGTIPYTLEWNLTGWTRKPVTVINAAVMGATAGDYEFIIERQLSLQPDVVVLYDDLGLAPASPRVSRVARWFSGYTPALPLVLEEKGTLLQAAGSPLSRAAGSVMRPIGRGLRDLESPRVAPRNGPYSTLMLQAAARARTVASVLIAVDEPVNDVTQSNLAALRNAVTALNDPKLRLMVVPHIAESDLLLDGYSYGSIARGRVALSMGPELLALVK